MQGTKETNWNVPNHRCPRWYQEYVALKSLSSVVGAFLDGSVELKHLKLVYLDIKKAEERTNYEKDK